jgi:DNA repair exonuclease SbcCD nuclease subunit
MVRFLHTADWQLGMTRAFFGDGAQAEFSAARIDAVRRICALADREDCAFVVACGDLFESNHVDGRTVLRACDALAESRVPVYLLPGNHDPLDASSVYRSEAFRSRKPDRVHVLESNEPLRVAEGVELVGAPWATKRPVRDLVAEACARLEPSPPTLRVLAGHGAVDAVSPDRGNPALVSLEAAERALSEGRVHYVALGDRHSFESVGASGRIVYAGTPEPTDFDEVRPGCVACVDLAPSQCEVRPVEVGTWTFLRREVRLSDSADVDALRDFLRGIARKDRTALRLALVGTLSVRERARLEALLDEERLAFASLEESSRRSDLAVVADDEDFSGLRLGGFAARAVARLKERAAGGGEEAVAARDALGLLHRLAGGGGR